jgi:signal transduction histidine kinase
MAQEALSNIVHHAQASDASLSITFEIQSVTLEVTDNGMGFEVPKSPSEFAPSGYFGLLGLHERAELIGAKLEIQSRLGQGSLVSVYLPTA